MELFHKVVGIAFCLAALQFHLVQLQTVPTPMAHAVHIDDPARPDRMPRLQ